VLVRSKARHQLDWKTVKATKIPNIFQMEKGGHFVRAKVTDPVTGQVKQIRKALPEADEAMALQWLLNEKARIRSGIALERPQQTRFCDFAVDLRDEKVELGEIRSAKGKERWNTTLEHLIAGTAGVPGFGEMFIDRIHSSHVEEWKLGVAKLIAKGQYAPTTANGWLSILRVAMRAAKRKYGLTYLATEDVSDFDTSEHATYTEEEPNALRPDQVPNFLWLMRELYPQHYAMTMIGFATGLRPSTLRPLRRRGPTKDVLWDEKRLLIRRSVTCSEVMDRTKRKGVRYSVHLCESAMEVLVWHVENQLVTPQQADSDLLFPAIHGGYRAPNVLNKPFADVASELGLPHFTQRGMRRTFQDLMRSVGVENLVTRSISGHATETMQEHYSTVAPSEQRASIAKVISLFGTGGPTRHAVGVIEVAPSEGHPTETGAPGAPASAASGTNGAGGSAHENPEDLSRGTQRGTQGVERGTQQRKTG
jgi:integrase